MRQGTANNDRDTNLASDKSPSDTIHVDKATQAGHGGSSTDGSRRFRSPDKNVNDYPRVTGTQGKY
jgi:hypothetical protein